MRLKTTSPSSQLVLLHPQRHLTKSHSLLTRYGLSCNPGDLGADAPQIQHVANGAKDWDTKHMKTDILNLIPEKYLPDADIGSAVVRKVASSYIDIAKPEESKDWRGFNHGITACLLCPTWYIDQFKRDAEVYARCLIHHVHILITKYRTRRDLKQRRL